METVPGAGSSGSRMGREGVCPYVNVPTTPFPKRGANTVNSSSTRFISSAADASFSPRSLRRLSWLLTNAASLSHSSHFPLCHSLDPIPLSHNAQLLDGEWESVSLNRGPHHLVVNAPPRSHCCGREGKREAAGSSTIIYPYN